MKYYTIKFVAVTTLFLGLAVSTFLMAMRDEEFSKEKGKKGTAVLHIFERQKPFLDENSGDYGAVLHAIDRKKGRPGHYTSGYGYWEESDEIKCENETDNTTYKFKVLANARLFGAEQEQKALQMFYGSFWHLFWLGGITLTSGLVAVALWLHIIFQLSMFGDCVEKVFLSTFVARVLTFLHVDVKAFASAMIVFIKSVRANKFLNMLQATKGIWGKLLFLVELGIALGCSVITVVALVLAIGLPVGSLIKWMRIRHDLNVLGNAPQQ